MYVCKAAVICDRCGEKAETETVGHDPFDYLGGDESLVVAGWISPGKGRHLCPSCAVPYIAKKKEMEEELRMLSGVKTIEFDI